MFNLKGYIFASRQSFGRNLYYNNNKYTHTHKKNERGRIMWVIFGKYSKKRVMFTDEFYFISFHFIVYCVYRGLGHGKSIFGLILDQKSSKSRPGFVHWNICSVYDRHNSCNQTQLLSQTKIGQKWDKY